MTKNMSYITQRDPFKSAPLSKELINNALDLVFEEAIIGYNNFFVLQNELNGHFIQTVFSDGVWHIEYSNAKRRIYQKDEPDHWIVYAVFQDFYDNIEPDLSDYKKVELK